VVTVPTREDTQEAQQLPQNDNNDDDHEDDDEEEGNEDEDKDDEDYTPLSDSEKDKVYHDAKEIKTAGNEARSHWQTEGSTEPNQHHHSTII
jgi:hypothetical protein